MSSGAGDAPLGLTSCTRRLVKKGSLPTKSASGRSRTNVANTASISRLVLALRIWIWNPMARAADFTSLTVLSVRKKVGLTSTVTRVAAGNSSRRSSSRFATNSTLTKLIPVRLPPGRARLATRPSLTGSSPTMKTMGIVEVAALAANAEHLRSRQSLRPVGEPIRPPAPAIDRLDSRPSGRSIATFSPST